MPYLALVNNIVIRDTSYRYERNVVSQRAICRFATDETAYLDAQYGISFRPTSNFS